jgi:DNA-directed RNA polymerase subunit RPC12/RpoP
MQPETKYLCPKCQSEHTIPIVWGYPFPRLAQVERAKRGEVFLHGCIFDGDIMPDLKCTTCGNEFRVEPFTWGPVKKEREVIPSSETKGGIEPEDGR